MRLRASCHVGAPVRLLDNDLDSQPGENLNKIVSAGLPQDYRDVLPVPHRAGVEELPIVAEVISSALHRSKSATNQLATGSWRRVAAEGLGAGYGTVTHLRP